MASTSLLKEYLSPEPLHGGNEYKLCPAGFQLNLRHAEAQSREIALHAEMHETANPALLSDRFDGLKWAVRERNNAILAQFDHVKDCFVCSMAFGLTPEVKETSHAPFVHLVAKFGRLMTLFM